MNALNPRPRLLLTALALAVATTTALPAPAAERLDSILAELDMDALIASDPSLLTPVMDLAVRHRTDREVSRRPERGVKQQRRDRRIEPVNRRKAGEERVTHRLRHQHHRRG